MICPKGSSPIDFAFRVHSAVGEHCVGAKVNGRLVPLSYQVKNGDVIDIHHAPQCHAQPRLAGPGQNVPCQKQDQGVLQAPAPCGEHSGRARHAGKELQHHLLAHDAKAWGENPRDLIKDESLRTASPAQFNMPSEIELLAIDRVRHARRRHRPESPEARVAPPDADIRLNSKHSDDRKLRITAGDMETENIAFRRSRCCLPIPGDDVMGYVTRGRGMALHRRECPNARQYLANEADRCTSVEYVGSDGQVYQVYLNLVSLDRTGLLADVTNVFAENKTFITAIKTQSHRNKTATLELAIEVRNTEHLDLIIKKLFGLGDVVEIHRASGGREEPRVK